MTADAFRKLALGFPETVESEHMGHPDFRVCGRVFASLSWPDKDWGMVKLTPDLQQFFVDALPQAFVPVNGAWGRRGCTNVRLKTVTKTALRHALDAAWRNVAPAALVKQREGSR
jgi:hypothetical protein